MRSRRPSAVFLLLVTVAAVTLRCATTPARSPAEGGPGGPAPFTLVAIGDTGKLTQDLYDNALGVTREISRAKAGQRALVFLGDNFYEYGLGPNPIAVR